MTGWYDIPPGMKQSTFCGLLCLGLMTGCLQSNPQGLYERSLEAIARGNYDQGISGLDKTIQSQPEFAAAYINRGIAYAETGNIPKAIADYKKAIDLNPKLAEAYFNLGNAQMQLKSYDQAIAAYDQAIQLDPQYGAAYGNRGNAYQLTGNTENAIADIEQAAQIFDNQGNSPAAAIAHQTLAKLKKTDVMIAPP